MKYLVVDGQQRLTTLTLLLAAIRDHLLDTGQDASAAERIGYQYLINQWQESQPKLLPTRADRESYLAVINRFPDAGGGMGSALRTGTCAQNWLSLTLWVTASLMTMASVYLSRLWKRRFSMVWLWSR